MQGNKMPSRDAPLEFSRKGATPVALAVHYHDYYYHDYISTTILLLLC